MKPPANPLGGLWARVSALSAATGCSRAEAESTMRALVREVSGQESTRGLDAHQCAAVEAKLDARIQAAGGPVPPSFAAHRLYDAQDGGPYRPEAMGRLSLPDADAQASKWWMGDERTVLVAVTGEDGKARSVYERRLDAARAPAGWPWRAAQAPALRGEKADKEAARSMPDLGDEPKVRRRDPGACLCCLMRVQPGSADARDQTPSGRLGRGECPVCGTRLPSGAGRQVEQRYIALASGQAPTRGERP